jgi:hypothetical protein
VSTFKLVEGLVNDLSSEDYHGQKDSFSSSQFKDALKDMGYFHAKNILKTVEKEDHIPAFRVGTYFHTAVLEPDKLVSDCVVFEVMRRGAVWDKFQVDNKGKTIVSEGEQKQADNLVSAVRNSPIAMNRIGRGSAEISAFVILRGCGSDIYAPSFGKVLGKHGWVDAKVIPKKGTDVWVKTRADLLSTDFILDLKSTGGNAKDAHAMKGKVSALSYDLSASLYLDVFSLVTKRAMTDFIWTFASKDYGNCQNYMASATNILVGRAKWRKAFLNIVEGIENNWVLPDTMEILEPSYFEYDILKETGENLL